MNVLKKLGVITISKEIYEQDYSSMIHELFKSFQPLEIKYKHFPAPVYECTGLHDSFDPIKEGAKIPTYEVTCIYKESLKPHFSFKRQ